MRDTTSKVDTSSIRIKDPNKIKDIMGPEEPPYPAPISPTAARTASVPETDTAISNIKAVDMKAGKESTPVKSSGKTFTSVTLGRLSRPSLFSGLFGTSPALADDINKTKNGAEVSKSAALSNDAQNANNSQVKQDQDKSKDHKKTASNALSIDTTGSSPSKQTSTASIADNTSPKGQRSKVSSAPSPAKEAVVEEQPKLRSWYVKYKQDSVLVATVNAANVVNIEANPAQVTEAQVKPSQMPATVDMSKWVVLDYSQVAVSAFDGKTQLNPTEKVFVDKFFAKRKKTIGSAKILQIDPERLGLTKADIRRQEIIYELIMTERDYVQDIRVLSELIIKKIRDKKLMTSTALKKTFSNVEDFPNINDELYRNLFDKRATAYENAVDALNNPKLKGKAATDKAAEAIRNYTVGDIFNNMAPFLRAYTVYCGAHTEGTEYLQSRLENAKEPKDRMKKVQTMNPKTAKKLLSMKEEDLLDEEAQRKADQELALFLQYCSFRPECKNLNIFAFMIKPIQRICKYPLLLRELLKHTEKTHPDYELLQKASGMIEKVVGEVNERRRFMEGQQFRMIDLRKRLSFTSAQVVGFQEKQANAGPSKTGFELLGEASRKIVFEGGEDGSVLCVRSDQTITEKMTSAQFAARWLILCNDVLILSKVPEKKFFSLKNGPSDKSKTKVKFVMNLMDIMDINVYSSNSWEAISIGSQKSKFYLWEISFDAMGKQLEKQPLKNGTLKRKPDGKASRVTFVFACTSADIRDKWIDNVKSAHEQAKKSHEERLKIMRDRTSKQKGDFDNIPEDVKGETAFGSYISEISDVSEPVHFDSATSPKRTSEDSNASNFTFNKGTSQNSVSKKVTRYGSYQPTSLFGTIADENEEVVTKENTIFSVPNNLDSVLGGAQAKMGIVTTIRNKSGSSVDLFGESKDDKAENAVLAAVQRRKDSDVDLFGDESPEQTQRRPSSLKQMAEAKLSAKSLHKSTNNVYISKTKLNEDNGASYSPKSIYKSRSHNSMSRLATPPREEAAFANPLYFASVRIKNSPSKRSIPDFSQANASPPPAVPLLDKKFVEEQVRKSMELVKSNSGDSLFGAEIKETLNSLGESASKLKVEKIEIPKEGVKEEMDRLSAYVSPISPIVLSDEEISSYTKLSQVIVLDSNLQPMNVEQTLPQQPGVIENAVEDRETKPVIDDNTKNQPVEDKEAVPVPSENNLDVVEVKKTEDAEEIIKTDAEVESSERNLKQEASQHIEEPSILKDLAIQEQNYEPVIEHTVTKGFAPEYVLPPNVSTDSLSRSAHGSNQNIASSEQNMRQRSRTSLHEISRSSQPPQKTRERPVSMALPSSPLAQRSKNNDPKNRVSHITARFESMVSSGSLTDLASKGSVTKSQSGLAEEKKTVTLDRIKTFNHHNTPAKIAPLIASRAKVYEGDQPISESIGTNPLVPIPLGRQGSGSVVVVGSLSERKGSHKKFSQAETAKPSTMKLTVSTEQGEIFYIDADPSNTLVQLKGLISKKAKVPEAAQIILQNGEPMAEDTKSLKDYGVKDTDIFLVLQDPSVPVPNQTTSTGAGSSAGPRADEIEQLRQRLINDPVMLQQLVQSQPAVADAALNNPQKFKELMLAIEQERRAQAEQQMQQLAALEADPFDVEAQKKIEELIKQQNIQANMEAAMEYNPESFGSVTMLYINCEVNGHHVKAFVDSGAQATIMSDECAERCGIMRLCDRRYQGTAMGVGTAKIIGRVHSAPLKLGSDADNKKNLFLQCSFTIMEKQIGVDMLLGLDMLKRFQASLDLKHNVLRVDDFVTPFLGEHEIPQKIGRHGLPSPSPVEAKKPQEAPRQASKQQATQPASSSSSKHPEAVIETLMALGVSRKQAIEALDAANGNPDIAAGLLFQ